MPPKKKKSTKTTLQHELRSAKKVTHETTPTGLQNTSNLFAALNQTQSNMVSKEPSVQSHNKDTTKIVPCSSTSSTCIASSVQNVVQTTETVLDRMI